MKIRAATFAREALFDNVGLKIVSLLCAFGFFVFIRGAERAEMRFDVGVAYTTPVDSANRVLIKEPPAELSVKLVGPRTQLESLPRDLGTIVLDLSSGVGNTIQVDPSMIPNIPPGLQVEEIFPSRIELRWDDVVAKPVPVQVGRTGDPPEDYTVRGSVTTNPETVLAQGPQSIVNLIQVARVQSFDVTGLTEGYHTRKLLLDLPPEGVSFNMGTVEATIEIAREERLSAFKGLRVDVIGAPKATTAPERVTVKVRGAPDVVASLEAEQIAPYVELPPETDLAKKGSVRARVKVDIPNVDAEVEPKEVTVKW